MPKKVEKKEEIKSVAGAAPVPAPEAVVVAPEPAIEDDIKVADPEVLRPTELPLVVTSEKGWANEAQEEYARILNGYAYSNPAKWAQKKAQLLKNLRALATEPHLLNMFKGNGDSNQKLAYKNHITQSN